MKITRVIRGAVAKPYIRVLSERQIEVTIRSDKLGNSITLYDGEVMLTIPLEAVSDVLRVNQAAFIHKQETRQREAEYREVSYNEPIYTIKRG